MSGKPKPGDIQKRLGAIAKRRNQIVHEADVIAKTRVRAARIRPIEASRIRGDIKWLDEFVRATDIVVTTNV